MQKNLKEKQTKLEKKNLNKNKTKNRGHETKEKKYIHGTQYRCLFFICTGKLQRPSSC